MILEPSSGAVLISVVLDLSSIPPNATQVCTGACQRAHYGFWYTPGLSSQPSFAMITIDQSSPSSPHAVGVTVSIDDVPPVNPKPPSPSPPLTTEPIFSSAGFKLGVGLTLAALFCSAAAVGLCVWRLRRCFRPKAPPGTASSGTARWGLFSRARSPEAGRTGGDSTRKDRQADEEEGEEGEHSSLTRGAKAIETTPLSTLSPANSIEMVRISPPDDSSKALGVASVAAPLETAPLPASRNPSGPLQLRVKPLLKASDFEPQWRALPTVELWGATLAVAPIDGELQALMSRIRFACLASGTVAGVSKYYFYAQGSGEGGSSATPLTGSDVASPGATTALCIVEASVALSSLHLSLVVKASTPALGELCAAAIRSALDEARMLKAS